MRNKFYVARGLKKDYERIKKYEGELYYLKDTGELANCRSIYKTIVDGGYFLDYEDRSKFNGSDGGEF